MSFCGQTGLWQRSVELQITRTSAQYRSQIPAGRAESSGSSAHATLARPLADCRKPPDRLPLLPAREPPHGARTMLGVALCGLRPPARRSSFVTPRRTTQIMAAPPQHRSGATSTGGSGGARGAAPAPAAAATSRSESPAAPSAPPSALPPAAQRAAFYSEAAAQLAAGPALTSVHDREIGLLFFPALLGGLLEPIQQSAETLLVGRLGVTQVGICCVGGAEAWATCSVCARVAVGVRQLLTRALYWRW